MRILVTGGNGQLGSELKFISSFHNNIDWIFTDICELDLSEIKKIDLKLNRYAPDIIINCAAYTNVDKAESNKKLVATINCDAVDSLSKWSLLNKSKLIHISTDYVFDGNSEFPLNEKDKTNPINVYGLTKLDGEKVCMNNDPNSIIIRTSWVYSSYGSNFVKTISSQMNKKKYISVIDDQKGSPTYAKDLAEVIVNIINYQDWIPGLYHYSNDGELSWFDFAKLIKKYFGYNTIIKRISSKEYPTPAKRPSYTIMDKSKIKTTFGIKIPKCENSLKKCIKILKNET